MVPTTYFGKIFASFTALWGIILIGLPIAVIGNNFTKIHEEQRRKNQINKKEKQNKIT
jgi:hypothetical protein